MTVPLEQRADLRQRIAATRMLEQSRNYKEAITSRMRIRSDANELLPALLDALDEADKRDADAKAEIVRLRRIIAQLRKGEDGGTKSPTETEAIGEGATADGTGLAQSG